MIGQYSRRGDPLTPGHSRNPLLTGGHEVRYLGDCHPLIVEMLRALPPPGEEMSAAEMERWLRAFEGVLRVVYRVDAPARPGDGEGGAGDTEAR